MELWRNKYRMERFAFEDRKAMIVFPEKRDSQGRWALKTEYFAAFQELEEALALSPARIADLRSAINFLAPVVEQTPRQEEALVDGATGEARAEDEGN